MYVDVLDSIRFDWVRFDLVRFSTPLHSKSNPAPYGRNVFQAIEKGTNTPKYSTKRRARDNQLNVDKHIIILKCLWRDKYGRDRLSPSGSFYQYYYE
mmetsp:Transcript_27417/g.64258  ORF Transcript_27417/g.64258 Transcript_27417/m.64258 type:complete len:97 (+) Transcript_27417:844-1134(+)